MLLWKKEILLMPQLFVSESHGRQIGRAVCVGGMAYSLCPVNHSYIANRGHLRAHVRERERIALSSRCVYTSWRKHILAFGAPWRVAVV